LVLGFFCGIRPIGELRKVRWGDVSIAEKEVVIRSEVAKTRRKRVIKLSDSAIAWLETFLGGRNVPSRTEKVVPFSLNILRKKRERLGEQWPEIRSNGSIQECATPSVRAIWRNRERQKVGGRAIRGSLERWLKQSPSNA
jgi:integrase